MFLEERYTQILDILNTKGRVAVKSLAQSFDVTEDCIRKYLKELESLGKLKRVYGGAIPISSVTNPYNVDIRQRKTIHLEFKQLIARKALSVITEGDILFLDCSTTNLELANLLCESTFPLTVITNMTEITLTLASRPGLTLITIGGVFSPHAGGTVGSEAIRQISQYNYDKAFIGVCGVNIHDHYLSSCDLDDGQTKKTIIDHAREVYLPMENEKFTYKELYRYSSFDKITAIITEDTPDASIVNALKEKSILLL